MSEDVPKSGFDVLLAKSKQGAVPNVTNSEVPTLVQLREIRVKYDATVTAMASAPMLKDLLKEWGQEQFTTYVVKTAKKENWEYQWNRKRQMFIREVEKAESKLIEKAAVDYVTKFETYVNNIITDIDNNLPLVMKELAARMPYMGDKELLAFAGMLNKMRDGILDRISAAQHKAPTGEGKQKETERELLAGLGVLGDLIALAGKKKEELDNANAIDAEYAEVPEEVAETRAKIFGELDAK